MSKKHVEYDIHVSFDNPDAPDLTNEEAEEHPAPHAGRRHNAFVGTLEVCQQTQQLRTFRGP